MGRVKKKQAASNQRNFWKLISEQAIIMLCYVVFFLVGAYISFLFGCKQEQCFYIACGALHPAAALSAASAAKRVGKNGIAVGLTKTLFCNLIVLGAALLCAGFHPDLRLAISAVILVISAALGGIAGVNIRHRPAKIPGKGRRK